MPNYKQLCTDLLTALKSWSPAGGGPLEGPELEHETALIARAETALASDEPSPPSTDEMFNITPEMLAQCYFQPALAAYKQAYENSQKAGLAPWPKHHDAGIEAVLILALDRRANADELEPPQ